MVRFTQTISRRTALLGLGSTGLASLMPVTAFGQADPLPAWTAGAAKTAILSFVTRVTTAGSP